MKKPQHRQQVHLLKKNCWRQRPSIHAIKYQWRSLPRNKVGWLHTLIFLLIFLFRLLCKDFSLITLLATTSSPLGGWGSLTINISLIKYWKLSWFLCFFLVFWVDVCNLQKSVSLPQFQSCLFSLEKVPMVHGAKGRYSCSSMALLFLVIHELSSQ